MPYLTTALSTASSNGTFTHVNNNPKFSSNPPSGQSGKENVPPSYYLGQSVQSQNDEFEHELKKSAALPRSLFEESLDDVGLFPDTSTESVDPQNLSRSIEADALTNRTDSDDEPEYIYQDVLAEARQLAMDEQPEFCIIHRPKSYKKTVYHCSTDEEVVMRYKNLGADTRFGY